ncbi:MAG: type II toxin-antitoxin system VapC family toxin [Opitutales bacterium]|nr:type II toxin-antitoxin system VapC family toxin [Opitutales bacterium]
MTYYDTAFLAKCYLRETGHETVRAHARAAGLIACCEIGRVELMAVFQRHFREGRLDRKAFGIVIEQFNADEAAGIWKWLPVTPFLLDAAARHIVDLPTSVFLRAADAIHLTCALSAGLMEIFTNDRHLLAACPSFGLAGRNLLAEPPESGPFG